METQVQKLEHASAMPAPTWHFLDMNDATIEVPKTLAASASARKRITVQGSCSVREANGEFEAVLADAQKAWEQSYPAPSAEELVEREAYRAAEADATYGGTARSAYQIGADELEESRSLSAAFAQGAGDDAAAFLHAAAGDRTVIQVDSGKVASMQLAVDAASESVEALAIDVIAHRGSSVDLSILVDSPDCGAETCGDERPLGFVGTTLRVFADADAQVNITRMQTLDDGFVDVDDMGLFAGDRARISVCQTVLGGSSTFTGLAGDLRGDEASAHVETRYLGHGSQSHDFNYVLRHHGARTKCNLDANGVLAGSSSKTLRGTIDLIRGCKGAEGSENETVLLVDEAVRNKTVPVILCNEDDVAGNHGATIGHIRDEQLFYLASRGLSKESAEAMFVEAVIERAAIDASSDSSRSAVIRLGERLAPGFSELFEEGGSDA